MKRFFSYGAAMFILCSTFTGCKKFSEKKISERVTLKQKDKIPYGASVAFDLLPSLFPRTSIFYDHGSPGNWESLTATSYNQAVILVAVDFNADDDELGRIAYFAREGNYVFIIAKTFSQEAMRFFNFSYSGHSFDSYLNISEDSLSVQLSRPSFAGNQTFVYPGRKFASSFTSLDSSYCQVLGTDENKKPNFLAYKIGQGRVFIHIAPLAFSNYFILHKNNVHYYEQALSVIPAGVERVAWNEYYLSKPATKNGNDEPSWYRVLFRYPAFKWGLLTGLFTLIVFGLLGSRRKQRKIPPYFKPQNDSLDFVKTLGRLYHDRRDHKNLAGKMSVYFLEHVRSTFKLPTHTLDENFVKALHFKSGYPIEKLNEIFSFISFLDQKGTVSEKQLSEFHRQLEMFYQTT